MGVYFEQKNVLKTLDEVIKVWDKNCGISRMEYLRIRFRNFPSADVAPVVHGRWKQIGADKRGRGAVYMCVPSGEVETCGKCFPIKTKFCPNCGAKMDL